MEHSGNAFANHSIFGLGSHRRCKRAGTLARHVSWPATLSTDRLRPHVAAGIRRLFHLSADAVHQQKADQYLREKRPDLAIPEFAAVVAADPNNLDAQANLGVLLFFAGKPEEAEPHLRAALAIDPSLAKLRMLLGTCEHHQGHLEDARRDISAALPQITDPKVRQQAGLEIIEIDTSLNDLTRRRNRSRPTEERLPG